MNLMLLSVVVVECVWSGSGVSFRLKFVILFWCLGGVDENQVNNWNINKKILLKFIFRKSQ